MEVEEDQVDAMRIADEVVVEDPKGLVTGKLPTGKSTARNAWRRRKTAF